MTRNNDKPISVRLPDAQKRAIDEEAKRLGMNRTEFIKQTLVKATQEKDDYASTQPVTAQLHDSEVAEQLRDELLAAIREDIIAAGHWLDRRNTEGMEGLAQRLEPKAEVPRGLKLSDFCWMFLAALLAGVLANHGPEVIGVLIQYLPPKW